MIYLRGISPLGGIPNGGGGKPPAMPDQLSSSYIVWSVTYVQEVQMEEGMVVDQDFVPALDSKKLDLPQHMMK